MNLDLACHRLTVKAEVIRAAMGETELLRRLAGKTWKKLNYEGRYLTQTRSPAAQVSF